MIEQPKFWRREAEGLSVTEQPIALSILKVRKPNQAITDSLGAAMGLDWPHQPNSLAGTSPRVAWLSLAEWGVFAPAQEVRARVSDACAGVNHLLVDVSAGRRLWRIEGPLSRGLIATACSLDTHPSVLPPGRCAQSLFADTSALLIPLEDLSGFDLVAEASFAAHLRAWFVNAFRELQS